MIGIFGRTREYEALYMSDSIRLDEAVPQLFAHVLNFLVRARIYFSRSSVGKSNDEK